MIRSDYFPTNSFSSFDEAFSPDMPKSFSEDSAERSSVASVSLRFRWHFLCRPILVALRAEPPLLLSFSIEGQ